MLSNPFPGNGRYHFDEPTTHETPHETDWSPQRYIMTSRSLTKKSLGAKKEGKARSKNALEKSSNGN